MNRSLFQGIKEEFGLRYIKHSCIADEKTQEIFKEFVSKHKVKHAVEIGTWYGVSALALSYLSDKVSTIDIKNYPESDILWNQCDLKKKITPYIIGSEEEKADLVDILDFDFAFIDGGHRYDSVKLDFAIVKKCGRVLFHDYYIPSDNIVGLDGNKDDWVKRFVDELPRDELVIKKPFAYWEKR